MSNRLEDLTPETERSARRALDELRARGIQQVVTSTLRTAAEQYALWLQGRAPLAEVNAARARARLAPLPAAENTYTVTNCDGRRRAEGGTGRSPHQLGTALDVVPDLDPSERERPGWPPASDPRWQAIAVAFEARGFEWGGRWTKERDGIDPDCPHYQYRG
jgi:peptidoglycan L-alanyl-D-glutamate endopeptidase CwlK